MKEDLLKEPGMINTWHFKNVDMSAAWHEPCIQKMHSAIRPAVRIERNWNMEYWARNVILSQWDFKYCIYVDVFTVFIGKACPQNKKKT